MILGGGYKANERRVFKLCSGKEIVERTTKRKVTAMKVLSSLQTASDTLFGSVCSAKHSALIHIEGHFRNAAAKFNFM